MDADISMKHMFDGTAWVAAQQDFSRAVEVVRAHPLKVLRNVYVRRAGARAGALMDAHAAEDAVVLVLTGEGVALLAVLARTVYAPAYLVRVAVVPAPDVLTQVSAERGLRAHERAGYASRGFGYGGIIALYRFILRERGELHIRAYLHAGTGGFNLVQVGDGLDIHQLGGVVGQDFVL